MKSRKGLALADGSPFLVMGKKNRGRMIAQLKSIGHSPNSVTRFTKESDLAIHLANRISATADKRAVLIAQLYAESRKNSCIQIGGALLKDRSGKSSFQTINNKTVYKGRQAGHIAIGTYSINGQVASQKGLEHLQYFRTFAYPIRRVGKREYGDFVARCANNHSTNCA